MMDNRIRLWVLEASADPTLPQTQERAPDYMAQRVEDRGTEIVVRLWHAKPSVAGAPVGVRALRDVPWWTRPESYIVALEGSPRRWQIVRTVVVHDADDNEIAELYLKQNGS